MSDPHAKDKAEEEKKPAAKKPPGWRNFQKVLKRVIKAPPLRQHPRSNSMSTSQFPKDV